LRLLHAFNIPIAPEYHQFNKVGDIKRFTLIFPAIPKHWDRFSLKEIAGGHMDFMSLIFNGIPQVSIK